jgi:predicted DNA-binding protein
MNRQIAFTLRFDPNTYERVKTASHREGRSITAFVQEAVTDKLEEKERASLFDAFGLVGEDVAEADVEYARDAQGEVALNGD